MNLEDQLLESWEINNRINLYVLESLDEQALKHPSRPKFRTVADQFAHVHNVRLMWLKASAPDLLDGLEKIESGSVENAKTLTTALNASSVGMVSLLRSSFETGKVKGFKPHPTAFLSYLLAHEAHHRGQILLTLKLAGYKIDQKILYGLWEWGVR